MLQNKEKTFVSCVVYLHNESDEARDFLEKICQVMQENFEKYEVVCVNDGCVDDTIEQVKAFAAESGLSPVVSLVNLSYYQGVECAMNAGCDLAVGDFLFEFDSCRLDFEPALIMEIYHRALQGYDVVAAAPRYGVSFTSRLFYLVYNWGSRYQAKIRQERFRVVSRRAVNRVNQLNAYVPYRKAMYMNSGLKTDTIVYDNKAEAAGRSRNREERGNRSTLAADTIIIFTNVLEKLSMTVSAVLLGALVIMFIYLIWSIFSKVRPVEGWLSIMMLMAFGFFMVSVMLTLILKYLSVLLNMGFKKQRYVIEGVEKLTQ
ncbi:MAG: glycosyltransferase [Eubacterium sp.]|nr:glycosyltransferase [Eubacterium sp.]MCM1215849.1 glycosyltransferase [Lachnospiraceae bacterium]MCM1305033.1 glycosyltransferase [Butyrivibrio sp.]MCM1344633.1 glycosyltransferase [Muribaculaceae bacterium]MCM1239229.1 glycosyltransferase [Lachnospiraceae bacterium]